MAGWNFTALKVNSKASHYLDALRWIAAVYVMIYHLRPVLFQGFNQVENKNALVKAAYLLTSMGYEFVMLFFVLSGFLISASVLKSVKNGTFSWKTYLINRFTRLWVVLISALILTSLLAQLQLNLFPDSDFFINNLKWSDFLGNLFFLQGVFFPNYGGNLPLWSLSYEFWYYILFPCLVLMVASRSWLSKTVYGIAVAGLSVMLGKAIMLYFLIWLLGALLVILPAPRVSEKRLAGAGIPLTAGMAVLVMLADKLLIHRSDADLMKGFLPQLAVSVCFAGLIYILLHAYNYPAAGNASSFNIHVFLAGFSYTLYLTHYPIINLLRVWLGDGHWGTWPPDLLHIVLGLMIALFILVYAWIISRCTEAHTSEVRAWLTRQLNMLRFKRRNSHENSRSRYGLD
ncbi:acyltransferase [Paenibacillus filicis]|uniref:Acyltransferase n=1 Tax=Paenibacillus gyeongsangnamensis TaxID=3388067 RepID=A0ABT4QHW2_9BACL|nr:acyltransferase [Paenibacillus filicis]MCZ8516469.1 acyltransferase [Paenibacillus filicis]